MDGILTTNVLESFPQTPHAWDDNVPFRFVVDVFAVVVFVNVTAAVFARIVQNFKIPLYTMPMGILTLA